MRRILPVIYLGLVLMGLSSFQTIAADVANNGQKKQKSPEPLEQGIKVGAQIPVEINLPDQSGLPKSLADITGPKGVILLFNRSSDWCRYCIAQMKRWNEQIARFEDLGYNIAALTYDDITQQRKFAMKHNIKYPVLSDQGSTVIQSFGLLNEKYPKDSHYYGIPHPAIYVIDPSGKITHRFAYANYQERPSPDIVLSELSEDQDSE